MMLILIPKPLGAWGGEYMEDGAYGSMESSYLRGGGEMCRVGVVFVYMSVRVTFGCVEVDAQKVYCLSTKRVSPIWDCRSCLWWILWR